MAPTLSETEDLLDYLESIQHTYGIRSFTIHNINVVSSYDCVVIIDTDTGSYEGYLDEDMYYYICTELQLKPKRIAKHLHSVTTDAVDDLLAALFRLRRTIKIDVLTKG